MNKRQVIKTFRAIGGENYWGIPFKHIATEAIFQGIINSRKLLREYLCLRGTITTHITPEKITLTFAAPTEPVITVEHGSFDYALALLAHLHANQGSKVSL